MTEDKERGAIVKDREVAAMARISKEIEALPEVARARVIQWVWGRYIYPNTFQPVQPLSKD